MYTATRQKLHQERFGRTLLILLNYPIGNSLCIASNGYWPLNLVKIDPRGCPLALIEPDLESTKKSLCDFEPDILLRHTKQ